MAPSTIRKAIGVMKDQTSISIAKVSKSLASDLEILVVKATSHEAEPANEKHVTDILNITDSSKSSINACLTTISKRLSKSRDWIVVLKCLILVHRLLIEGNSAFQDEIIRSRQLFNLLGFRDEAHSTSWDHSAFVKSYASYLKQMVEFQVYERIKRERRVLERAIRIHRVLDRFLACRPNADARRERIILIALYPMVKESFRLYSDLRDTTIILLDKVRDLDSARGLDVYLSVSKQIEEIGRFYDWCKEAGVARCSEYPEVKKLDERMIEEFLKGREDLQKADGEDEREENLKVRKELQRENESESADRSLIVMEDLLSFEEEEEKEVSLGFLSAESGSPEMTGEADWEMVLVESARRFSGGDGGSPAVDPFAASLAVPPPPYVQVADMEKKQQMVVHEQQQWRELAGQMNTWHEIGQRGGSYGSMF